MKSDNFSWARRLNGTHPMYQPPSIPGVKTNCSCCQLTSCISRQREQGTCVGCGQMDEWFLLQMGLFKELPKVTDLVRQPCNQELLHLAPCSGTVSSTSKVN